MPDIAIIRVEFCDLFEELSRTIGLPHLLERLSKRVVNLNFFLLGLAATLLTSSGGLTSV